MFENKYPYTDFSQLNLDWFLGKFKEITDEVEQLKNVVETLSPVEANPTLDGTEPLLTGLQVGDDKYKAPDETKIYTSVAGTEPDAKGIQVGDGLVYKMPGGGTSVVANPVLDGTEPLLTGLQVDNDKYKAPANVTPNAPIPVGVTPTALTNLLIDSGYYAPDQTKLYTSVSGTEPDVKGIQVGNGLIYKIPDNHLYSHTVNIIQNIDANNNMDLWVLILNTSSDSITLDDLKNILNNGEKLIIMSGYIVNGGITRSGLYITSQSVTTCLIYQQAGTGTISISTAYSSISSVTDTIHQIF